MPDSPKEIAIARLMTICPHPTPRERRIYAEWIVEAILLAAATETCERLLDANREVSK